MAVIYIKWPGDV